MTLKIVKPLVLFTVCATLASSLGAGLVSCGGSSGNGRPGAGGSTASSGGNGGMTGSGGSVGTGGTAACTMPIIDHGALDCTQGVSPANPLLTDFTEGTWNNTMGKWGCGFNGATYSYAGPKSTMVAQVNTMAHNLQLSGDVASGDYAGGGLSFGQCVNTTVYSGVEFTLGGTSDRARRTRTVAATCTSRCNRTMRRGSPMAVVVPTRESVATSSPSSSSPRRWDS